MIEDYSLTQAIRADYGVDQRLEEFEAVCWWGGSDRYSELEEGNQGQTWFSIEYKGMPENPENPVPVFGQLNNTVREDRGFEQHTCKWVHHANTGDPKRVYNQSGEVISVTSEIGTLKEDREFSADSISVSDDYSSKMRSDLFRDVSEEWQSEAGYDRTDQVTRNGYNYLDCLPNAPYFHQNTSMC